MSVDYTRPQREAFGARLSAARQARPDLTRQDIAEAVGLSATSGSAVNQWEKADIRPPHPPVVFALEQLLGLEAGELARHLGYLPAGADLPDCTVETAVASDYRLTLDARHALLGIYRQFTGTGGR